MMPFAITVANLIETMKQPGCPICIVERNAARKAVDMFLWESMMEPKTRETAMQAYGFCPPHTRLLVAADLSHSGLPLATNIIYEQLHGRTLQALRAWQGRETRSGIFRKLLARLGFPPPALARGVLTPTARCPICASAEQSTLNMLAALFEEMENEAGDVTRVYADSDGLCLAHLRMGLSHLAQAHPRAARRVVDLSTQRLAQQRERMQEFLRKKNWEYRDEALTEEESHAWRDALTFYTGFPGKSFTHKRDDEG
jgi:hypothetical protein